MKIVLYVLGAVVGLVVLVLLIGLALPRTHTATVRARYSQAPERLFEAISDVAHGPTWRTGLDSVQVLSQPNDPLMWREHASWGALTFVHDEVTPHARVVSRISDESEGFGGNWTYEITPGANGSVVTITENGFVDNPLFRFMSRFIFGHYRALETYARDLGRKFNEDVQPERVK